MLKISEYKNYIGSYNFEFYNLMENFFKSQDVTDKRSNRIYYDLNIDPKNFKVCPPKELQDYFWWNNLRIIDYVKGLCVDEKGQEIKIGKLLNKRGEPSLIKLYSESKNNSLKNYKKLKVVISRHPYDIIGMSTDRGWTTCLDLSDKRYGGSHLWHLRSLLNSGCLIAYLIHENDLNINNPISRVVINYYEPWNSFSIDSSIYGTYVKEFEDFIIKFCGDIKVS